MSNLKLLTTIVNKAMLDMGSSQNLDEFNEAMRDAAADAHPELMWVWIAQVSPSRVVIAGDATYYEHDWSIEDGAPKLSSESTEVEPETEYRPKRN